MSDLQIHETIVETVSDGEPMAVLRKRPAEGGPHPAIVMFHDGPGMRDATHVFARRLAGNGYDVAVPDLYHRLGRMCHIGPAEVDADPDAGHAKIFEMLSSLTDAGIQADLDAAMAILASDRPEGSLQRLGCIGFCLGARAVFRTMMRFPEQFVAGSIWHPSFLVDDGDDSPHLTAGQLQGGLYAGFGEADHMQTVEHMRPFMDAVAPLGDQVVVDILPDADHGYTWPDGAAYNEAGAERAWSQTLALFADRLG